MDNLPTPEDVCPMVFTEKTDFSIFLKYPDIDFDPESAKMGGLGSTSHVSSPIHESVEDGPGPVIYLSSPASDIPRHTDTDSTSRSISTPYTTPGRPGALDDSAPTPDEYQDYIHRLQRADLPETATHYYRSLADQILQIGAHLQPKTLYLSSTTTDDVLRDCSPLLDQLQQSVRVVFDQISAIDHITSLAPFTITPIDLALLPIYQQRASLIIAHLSLPSPTEHKLLSSLLPVFDAYIYCSYLLLPRHHFSHACSIRLNDLYSTINTLIHSYNTWLHAITRLKRMYVAPLLRRIAESSWVQTEIMQMENALEVCNRMNSRPISEIIGCKIDEEQVKGAEMLVERRRTRSGTAVKDKRPAAVRSQTIDRTRVRREYTW